MNSTARLTGSHLRTYQTIFQHPISHNLGWIDVHALFRHLGKVDEETNGNLRATRNGHVLVLHPPRTKDVDSADELMTLRHFLEGSETPTAAAAAANEKHSHWLLVINHHEARIFRCDMEGAQPRSLLLHEPSDYLGHAPNPKEHFQGEENPSPHGFFEPVAAALQNAGNVLIFGSGTGTSSEMERFIAWVETHRADLAERIIGNQVVDEHHLSDNQLLAEAREFYASIAKNKAEKEAAAL